MILGKILFRAFFIVPAIIMIFAVILKLLGFESHTAINIAGWVTVIIVSIFNIKDVMEVKRNEK